MILHPGQEDQQLPCQSTFLAESGKARITLKFHVKRFAATGKEISMTLYNTIVQSIKR